MSVRQRCCHDPSNHGFCALSLRQCPGSVVGPSRFRRRSLRYSRDPSVPLSVSVCHDSSLQSWFSRPPLRVGYALQTAVSEGSTPVPRHPLSQPAMILLFNHGFRFNCVSRVLTPAWCPLLLARYQVELERGSSAVLVVGEGPWPRCSCCSRPVASLFLLQQARGLAVLVAAGPSVASLFSLQQARGLAVLVAAGPWPCVLVV